MTERRAELEQQLLVLICTRCGATVGLGIPADAWCLPCERRMQPKPQQLQKAPM